MILLFAKIFLLNISYKCESHKEYTISYTDSKTNFAKRDDFPFM